MARRILGLVLCVELVLMLLACVLLPAPALAQTTSITITKYALDKTTILAQTTIDYQPMESTLPVQGDGITHQYLQGPVFEGDMWDPSETVNIKDWGANKGTGLMDLCELVGGMSPGDTVEVKATDGLSRTYDYPNVYTPDPRQGKMVICWWYNGQYVPAWSDGMRLVFFAETTNPDGLYVFGNWDQHECFPQNRWYFYNGQYPTTTGHSVKYVNQINIYSSQAVEYNLTILVSGNGTTTPSAGSHSYAQGTVVNITATPNSGWQFVGWTGNVANPNSASTTVTMDGDKTITANFTQSAVNYNLIMAVTGSGTTTPSVGSHSYAQGTVVNITATPASGWQFVNWTGDVANPNLASTTVTMDGDKTVTAHFSQATYELTIGIDGSGSTSPAAGTRTYAEGAVVSIKATPDDGWQFVSWSGDVANANSANTTVTINAVKTVTAHFSQVTQETVTPVPPTPTNPAPSPSPPTSSIPPPSQPSGEPQSIDWRIPLVIVGGGVVIALVVLVFMRLRRR